MARLPLLPLHCKSAPASERYHRSSHGCTFSLHMWWYGLPTQSRGTCWPMAFSSSGRHSVTGEMAGRSMTDPSAARPPSTPPNPGTHYCRASKPPLSWDQGQVQGYSVRCAWNLITLPPNVPWPLSNNPLCRHPISSPPQLTGQLHTSCPSDLQAAASPGDDVHHLCFMEPGHLRLPRIVYLPAHLRLRPARTQGIECPTAPEGSEYHRLRMSRTPVAPTTALAIPVGIVTSASQAPIAVRPDPPPWTN